MRKRPIRRQVWLSEEEDERFYAMVEETGLTPSDLLRYLIKGYEPRAKPPQEFFDSIKQIRAIGNNLNQIARLANANGFVNGINLQKEIEKLDQLVIDIKKEYLLPKKKDGEL